MTRPALETHTGSGTTLHAMALVVAVLILSGCVSATPVRPYEQLSARPLEGSSRSILVKRLVSTIEQGAEVGTIQTGLLCVGKRKMTWPKAGQLDPPIEAPFVDRLTAELRKAGYSVVGGPPDPASLTGAALFEDSPTKTNIQTDYQIAAIIKQTAWNICYPRAGFGDTATSSGQASMEVEWQLYDVKAGAVVLTRTTGGAAKTETAMRGGPEAILGAFGAATQNLLADPEFIFFLSRPVKR